jgi:hypothetical protein
VNADMDHNSINIRRKLDEGEKEKKKGRRIIIMNGSKKVFLRVGNHRHY